MFLIGQLKRQIWYLAGKCFVTPYAVKISLVRYLHSAYIRTGCKVWRLIFLVRCTVFLFCNFCVFNWALLFDCKLNENYL